MHTINIGGKHFTGPSSFEELTQEQFIATVAIMQQAASHPSVKWMLLPALFRIPFPLVKKLSAEQRVALLELTYFLYDEENIPYKELIRKVHVTVAKKLPIRTLFGPGDGLKHLTFGEFMAAELKYDAFNSGNNLSEVDAFCGILYRKTDKSRKGHEDKRILFQESLIDQYARDASGLEPHVKTAIALQYHGMKSVFPRLFPHVFPTVDADAEDEGTTPKKATSASMTWLNAAISLANDDVTKVGEIQKTKLHLVLKFLDDSIKNSNELKRKMEAARSRK